MPAPENKTTEVIRVVIAVVISAFYLTLWVVIIGNVVAGKAGAAFCLFPATIVSAWCLQRIIDFYRERKSAK